MSDRTGDYPLPYPPIIGVSGASGSGKTLLIERLVPLLRKRGARAAVVKHSTRHMEADTPGKDTDRIFKAGADVLGACPSESFARFHGEDISLWQAVRRVAAGCDVCLVEGYRGQAIPRIRIVSTEADSSDADDNQVLFTVTDVPAQVEDVEKIVWDFVEHSHRALPLMGLILPAAPNSSQANAENETKRIVATLAPHVRRVFLSGEGPASSNLGEMDYLLPAPSARMPLAGILSAMRWHPAARWVVAQGNSPLVESCSIELLLSQIRPGVDAVLLCLEENTSADPPLAVYDPTCLPRLEVAAMQGITSPVQALGEDHIARSAVPL